MRNLITCLFVILLVSCTKDYLKKPSLPKPVMGEETDSLEASYISEAITSVNAAYWSTADFLFVDSIYDLNTGDLYVEDGLLNLSGTYNGTADFNNGDPVAIRLKAAYDDEYLYIMAEWEDNSLDLSYQDWLWNGPADPLKSDSTNRWTSQRNNDKIAFAFDIDGAVSGLNTFSNNGCAASCHDGGSGYEMKPESGNVDIWNWSLSLSEPVGYAFDMHTGQLNGLAFDAGSKWFKRNAIDSSDNRSGPAFEWDGLSQNISRPLGSLTILDPAWYLLNKTPAIGDPISGASLYKNETKGCEGCHGQDGVGNGVNGDGTPFNDETSSRKFSRQAFKDYAASSDHEGKSYYDGLTSNQADHLIAYIKGLAGIPGYYLEEPNSNESIADVESNAGVNVARVNTSTNNGTYKVMFKRKLDTGNGDDTNFDPSLQIVYPFGVALMDNDGKNHVGTLLEYLIFKEK
ncbi:MAG: hypothetical protein HKN92_01640 [Chitinophagales bacterium]|nr:hypothetical protein [Chitinophagales bacterium]